MTPHHHSEWQDPLRCSSDTAELQIDAVRLLQAWALLFSLCKLLYLVSASKTHPNLAPIFTQMQCKLLLDWHIPSPFLSIKIIPHSHHQPMGHINFTQVNNRLVYTCKHTSMGKRNTEYMWNRDRLSGDVGSSLSEYLAFKARHLNSRLSQD